MWPYIRENLTEDDLLPDGPAESLSTTYPVIVKDMRYYGLPMPAWYEDKFLRRNYWWT